MIGGGSSNGSPPRERGQGKNCHIKTVLRRFTPARAGTGRTFGNFPVLLRFTPARAGTGAGTIYLPAASTVHPRASGDRLDTMYSLTQLYGSPPRERGQAKIFFAGCEKKRFTPARAGTGRNSSSTTATECGSPPRERGQVPWSVQLPRASRHGSPPRERGQGRTQGPCALGSDGSPPRERGQVYEVLELLVRGQAVHPRASGDRRGVSRATFTTEVHPRASGDRFFFGAFTPPKIRFTPARAGTGFIRHSDICGTLRFTPARAGTGYLYSSFNHSLSVHPRASGDRAVRSIRCSRRSVHPRASGDRPELWASFSPPPRFTPARAGTGTHGKIGA